MSGVPWAVRILLRLLPDDFRAAYGQEIAAVSAEYAGDDGARPRLLVWLRIALDVVVVGIGLRLRRTRRTWIDGRGAMKGLWRDVTFAGRALRRRPGFTAVAVLTLAVGIGANAIIFSVVNGVLLRPLPYHEADRIGILWHEFGDGAQNLPALHPLDAWDYRDRSELFDQVAIATGREVILGGQDDPELVDAGLVEPGFFELFGAQPLLGRTFSVEEAEAVPGTPELAVLSHRLWQRRFGGDPSIVGQSVEIAGASVRVVGVMPADFRLLLPAEAFRLRDAQVWMNLRVNPATLPPRNFTGFTGFVKLRDGASFQQAQAEVEAMAARLRDEHPVHASSKLEARVVPLLDDVVKGAEGTLLLLMGAVGFVLLIACANVANLVIVRGHDRSQELSVRAALGSGKTGLIRLVLAESLLLAAMGSGLGVALALGGLDVLSGMAAGSVPRLEGATIDGTVLGFVALVAVLTAGLFGMIPALKTARRDPAEVLNADARSGGSRRGRRFRDALVVAEVAASLVLLVGTGLMVRSFVALGEVDPGYQLDGVLTFRVSLPMGSFGDAESQIAVRERLLEELSALPGVEEAAAINQLPLSGAGALQPYAYDEETASNWESVTADQRSVTPGFFAAVGARLVAGRGFDGSDAVALNTIVIDDRLAARAFPEGDAVGRSLQIRPNNVPEEQRYARVVGVVEHLRLHDLSRPHLTQIYFPMEWGRSVSFVVRTSSDPGALVPAIRSQVERLAPGAPLQNVTTLQEIASRSLAPVRLALTLMTGFGVVALLLAAIGLYGVLAYTVSRRTREIGVRMALGQAPGAVLRLVMLDGGRLVGIAVILGLGAAAVLSRGLSGLVYGVEPLDPLTYGLTTVTLVAVAAVACWIPGRRATRVDPATALRE